MRRFVALALLLTACGTGADPGTTTTTSPPAPTTTTTAPATTTTTTPPSGTAEWALFGPDGLIHHEDGPVLRDGVTAWYALARDHDGGLVFARDGSLWWLPRGATEPRVVTAADGMLVEVVPTTDGPVARLGVCPSRFLSLSDGSEVDAPEDLAVLVDCDTGADLAAATRKAANGLEVAIVDTPAGTRRPDGLPGDHPDVLVVTRGGESLAEIPVGGFYETDARIHDFDGRFVIVSRGPTEPAMPVETFFVLDLEEGEVEYWGEHGASSAALLGRDVPGVPALPEDASYVHRGVPIFTDNLIADLPDGTYVGYIDHAATSGLTGGPEIHFDLIAWFTGKEADYAAAADGEESPAPNGYHIRNEDPLQIVLRVSPDVEVTSVWFFYESTGTLDSLPITYPEFVEAMTGEPVGMEMNMLADPWWVTIADGEVVAIHEQYVP